MIRLIHLSDFHLNHQNLKDWNAFIKPALISKLNAYKDMPDNTFIICSGDLVDKGGIEYESIDEALRIFKENVIDVLCEELTITQKQFIIVPGNHDIVRDLDNEPSELGYTAFFEKDYLNVSKFICDVIENGKTDGIKRIVPFKNFEKDLYNGTTNYKHTIFGSALSFDLEDESLGFACLNSAWRAYDDNDNSKLIIGEDQLEHCKNHISEKNIKIAVTHHPLDWLIPSEKGIITNHIYKDYDIVLLGHVHESETTMQTGFNGSVFINIAPTCTTDIRKESRAFSNGFTIIDFDKTNKEIDCSYFKYEHKQKEFVFNTDVVEDGRYCQAIPAPNSAKTKDLISRSLKYIKTEYYPVIDEHIITQKAHVTTTIKESFIMPPITDGDYKQDSNEANLKISDIASTNENLIFFGNQEIGKTTLLFRLIFEFVEEFVQLKNVPVYINIDEIGNKEYVTAIKNFLSCGTEEAKKLLTDGSITLLIDNLDYSDLKKERIQKLKLLLDDYQDVRIIATAKTEITGIAPQNYFENNKILFRNYFIKPLTTKHVKGLIKVWLPDEDSLKLNSRLDKMVTNFLSYSLPCTAMSVSLFLWSTENNTRKPINQAVLLDMYIELILEKMAKDNIYRDSFDYRNKTMLLAKIAKEMIELDLPNYSILYSDYVRIIENYLIKDVGFEYDAATIAKYFIDRRIFIKTSDNHIKFSYSCFFHFFIAKRMEFSKEFRDFVLQEDQYQNYHKEIDYYTGLTRNDKDVLTTVYKRFKEHFEPLEFILKEVNVDSFFTNVRKKESPHETTSQKIDINKIKDNRPTEQQLEAFYDQKISKIQIGKIIKKDHKDISLEQILVLACNILRNSEGVEDVNLKRKVYNLIIRNSVIWTMLYKDSLVHYLVEHKKLPPSIPNNVNFEALLQYLPYNIQRGIQVNLGTFKLLPIIAEKIKSDKNDSQCSDVEAYLSVALYADENGKDFYKYFNKFIKRISNNIVRDYCKSKLTNYYYLRTKPGSPNEELYLDLLTELRIRSQKLPRRMKEKVLKSISDGKKNFLSGKF